MIVLDSCVWIEFFADAPLAETYEEAYLSDLDQVWLLPTVLAEVLRWLARSGVAQGDIDNALAAMLVARTAPLGMGDAVQAAAIMALDGLPMADSLIYSQALTLEAELVTQDGHFEGLAGVRFHSHPSRHPDPAKRKRRKAPKAD